MTPQHPSRPVHRGQDLDTEFSSGSEQVLFELSLQGVRALFAYLKTNGTLSADHVLLYDLVSAEQAPVTDDRALQLYLDLLQANRIAFSCKLVYSIIRGDGVYWVQDEYHDNQFGEIDSRPDREPPLPVIHCGPFPGEAPLVGFATSGEGSTNSKAEALDALAAGLEQLDDVQKRLGALALRARELGASWKEIGDVSGASPQAAYQRWSPAGQAKHRDYQNRRTRRLRGDEADPPPG